MGEETVLSEPPSPLLLAYNSALASSSGHPVDLITMIPEHCPHLSQLKYGNYIIQVQEPLFSHGNVVTSTC